MKSISKPKNPAVKDFRQKYFEYVDEHAPDLMLDKFLKSTKETWFEREAQEWIRFYKTIDTKRFTLFLKPDGGKKDPFARACLEIQAEKERHNFIKSSLHKILMENMDINGNAEKSITVNIRFTALHATDPFENQIDAVKQSIDVLRQLHGWFKTHKSYLLGLANNKKFLAAMTSIDDIFIPSPEEVLEACACVETKNIKFVLDLIESNNSDKAFHPEWRQIVENEIMPLLVSKSHA